MVPFFGHLLIFGEIQLDSCLLPMGHWLMGLRVTMQMVSQKCIVYTVYTNVYRISVYPPMHIMHSLLTSMASSAQWAFLSSEDEWTELWRLREQQLRFPVQQDCPGLWSVACQMAQLQT